MNRQENIPIDYNGKQYTKYEALQRQRQLETRMRAERQKIKLLQDGEADETDIMLARAKYRGTSQEYTSFSKAMDLPQQRQRVAIDGLGNIGVGKWKIPVEKINLDDIIDLEDVNISKVIRSGKIELKINDGKQGKHIKGHNNYIEGRSYIIISSEEVQKLINKYAGTGMLIRTKNGKWAKQEMITTNTLIGYDVNDISGDETATKAFKIHYSNKGTHIVPKKE